MIERCGFWLKDRVHVSWNLDWLEIFRYHVTKLVCMLRSKIGLLYGNRTCFLLDLWKVLFRQLSYQPWIMVLFFTCMLEPRLCSSLWLRFIFDDNYNTHDCELHSEVGWPSLSVRPDRHHELFIIIIFLNKSPYFFIPACIPSPPFSMCFLIKHIQLIG